MEDVGGALLEERVGAQSPGEGEQESEHTSSLAGSQGNGVAKTDGTAEIWRQRQE